jgi:hypothetical protein
MGVDGLWWFYKVEKANFEVVQSEFDRAADGVPSLPEVPVLSPRPKAPPVTQDYFDSVLEGILAGGDLSSEIYHEPFESIADRISEGDFPITSENFIEMVMQSRVAPPAMLLMGIGSERFSQLPGYLGNMLIHPNKVEQTIHSVSRILDVDWESYFERAKLILDYVGFDELAAKDVSDVLQAIPKALEQVKNEGVGLLTLTSWGCP